MSAKLRIFRWHAGKLVILWSWGGIIAAVGLTVFFATPVAASPVAHLIAFLEALFILIALSVVTWFWLTGREENQADAESDKE